MRPNRNANLYLTRRQALAGAAATASTILAPRMQATASTKVCILTPEATQGPFYFDPKLVRIDITASLKAARVDVWHSDGFGLYSGYARQETGSSEGETFLRGTQFTDADGAARFNTIYPGWYPGRTPHIHFKVILDDKDLVTGQLHFPDTVSERIYATLLPYRERKAERDTFNANDFIFQKQGGSETLVAVEEDGASCRASLVIGIDRTRRS